MRESRTYGSVRGALSDGRPYRDPGGPFVSSGRYWDGPCASRHAIAGGGDSPTRDRTRSECTDRAAAARGTGGAGRGDGSGLGQYGQQGVPLSGRPLVRKDPTRQLHERGRGQDGGRSAERGQRVLLTPV